MAQLAVNTEDPRAYEYLSLIISEFEKAALRSDTREGLMVIAQHPLNSMEDILDGSDMVLDSTVPTNEETEDPGGNRTSGSNIQDPDLRDILEDDSIGENIRSYLRDCFNCDARIHADWQFKPVDFLGPIKTLLRDINLALSMFENQLNPYQTLSGLCDLLNDLNFFCIPDLITIMLSLKMLFKRYLQAQLDIAIDWTAILGPILKFVIEGVASLTNVISGIIVAPMECAVDALRTVHELHMQSELALQGGAQVMQRINQRARQGVGLFKAAASKDPAVQVPPVDGEELDAYFNVRDFEFGSGGRLNIGVERNQDGEVDDPLNIQVEGELLGRMSSSDRRPGEEPPSGTDFSVATGFRLRENMTLDEALDDPGFLGSRWTGKLIVAVDEARQFVIDFTDKVKGAAQSIAGLVSGGLSIQVRGLGLLLFLKDLISLVVMIIQMMTRNQNVNDWCDFLQENPEALTPHLGRFSLEKVTVRAEEDRLALYTGPKYVGEIKTCLSARSGTPQSDILNQWINDLKRNQ